MTNPELVNGREMYAVAKNGKIQMWKGEILDTLTPEGWKIIRATYGFTDGAKQTKDTFVKSGKNTGKKNETTLDQQTQIKLEQMYADKMKKNSMVWDVKDFVAPKRPMLAQAYKNRFKHLNNVKSWLLDRKLDGNRAYTYTDGLIQSKSGEKTTPLSHIQQEHALMKQQCPLIEELGIHLDGEYYLHGLDLTAITSIIRKKDDADRSTDTLLEYHVYDCFIPSQPELNALQRWEILKQVFDQIDVTFHKLSEKVVVENDKDLIDEIAVKFVEEGYEGAMLRDVDSPYMHSKNQTDRSDAMIKYKFMEDDEFQIVDIIENENEPGTPKFVIDLRNGNVNEVQMNGSKEASKEYLTNKHLYIGKWLKTQYQTWTIYGKLSFAKGLEVRDGTVNEHGFDPRF